MSETSEEALRGTRSDLRVLTANLLRILVGRGDRYRLAEQIQALAKSFTAIPAQDREFMLEGLTGMALHHELSALSGEVPKLASREQALVVNGLRLVAARIAGPRIQLIRAEEGLHWAALQYEAEING